MLGNLYNWVSSTLLSHDTENGFPPLCATCDRVLSNIGGAVGSRFPFAAELDYHKTLEAHIKSAKTCSLCAAFWSISPSKDYQYANLKKAPKLKMGKIRGNIVMLSLNEREKSGAGSIGNTRIALVDQGDKGQAGLSDHRSIWLSAELNLQNRLPMLEKWVTECTSSHAKCKSIFTSENPTRLLDLGADNRIIPEVVKLVEANDFPGNVQYTILSHSWGSSPSRGPLRTTIETLETHSRGIRVTGLPRTFQDAVQLTAAMSARYIWIDSLCIIQDDPIDWEKEAAKMASYYQNSLLTIAATSSADSTTGCFLNVANTGLVQAATPSRPHRTIAIRPSLPERSNVMKAPLNKRGWVLQESVLSTRLLHCTSDQWFWQCREYIGSEDGTFHEEDYDFIANQDYEWPPNAYQVLSDSKKMIGKWNHLVEAYSRRTLTFPKDKLAAFAGITEYFHHLTSDEPILGAWRLTLAYDLSWTTQYDERDSPAPVIDKNDAFWSRIPSWSWMSVQSRIHCGILFRLNDKQDQELITRATVHEWSISWSGPPMTSTLLSTSLTIDAPLRPRGALNEGIFDKRGDGQWEGDMWMLLLYEHSFRSSGEWIWEEVFLLVEMVSEEPLTCRRVGAGSVNTHEEQGEVKCFFGVASRLICLV